MGEIYRVAWPALAVHPNGRQEPDVLTKGAQVPDGALSASQLETLIACGGLVREFVPDQAEEAPAGGRPAKRADKALWVAYAVDQGLVDEADAQAMNKPELIARVELLQAAPPSPPAADDGAPPAAAPPA